LISPTKRRSRPPLPDAGNSYLARYSELTTFLPRVRIFAARGVSVERVSSILPEQAALLVRPQVAALDPILPVDIATLRERVSRLADQPKFQSLLISFFASTGLALALIGLYGAIAFLVAQRTHEVGIRLALGADRRDILRLVIGRSLRLIIAGTVLGLMLALLATRLLANLLFGVPAHDPATFGVAAVLLVLVALIATLLPFELRAE
jgi:putative ABC transport system permease protein